MIRVPFRTCLLLTASIAYALPVLAADVMPGSASSWMDGITVSGQIDAGGTWNPANPGSGKNFGRLLDDKADDLQLNELMLTVQRPIDTSRKDYDLGFKFQGIYGSDARYTHFLHELQHTTGDDTNQFDIFEANVQLHTPWFTGGGFDIKAGQYPALGSVETNDPSTNYFYSHSYVFNFGLPSKHTGVITTLHASPMVDIYTGIDTGVNTSLGEGDNNDALSFLGGVGLNLMGGDFTTLLNTHIGPENATDAVRNGLLPATVNANHAMRALTDIATTWKIDDHWTLLNDLDWVHDDALNAGRPADAFGMAQYAAYKINGTYTVVGRAEVFRDADGVFVAQSGNNVDYVRGEEGLAALSSNTVGGGDTTYGALTLGMNIRPALGIPQISTLLLRPEIRYDASLNGTRPFNDSSDKGMVTLGTDVVLAF